jgi:acetolactate synthase-1/2/3 large subunit
MGAKCAAPDRPVICFIGDAGMWYHLSELDTALVRGINTVTVVNNNVALNQEQALNAGKPAVIDVKTDSEGIAPAAWNG